jgi:hypothetical protein
MTNKPPLSTEEELKLARVQLFVLNKRLDALMAENGELKREVVHMRAKLKRLAKGHGS